MTRYMLVDLLIVAAPLALSFDHRVHFYTKWPAVFAAIVIVGTLYIVWDAYFARRGYWGFNPAHVSRARLFHLPVEEVLFFVTVPYSCLFVYDVVRAYLPVRLLSAPAAVWLAPAAGLLAAAIAARRKPYTLMALTSSAAFLALAAVLLPRMLASSHFWLYMLITYVPFLLFNGILTAIPIVTYNPEAILGLRITSIPLEDFFYSFSLLGLSALGYRLFEGLFGL